MIRFRERNQAVIGAVTIAVVVLLVFAALNFSRLPLVSNTARYQADFANAGRMTTGDIVTVHGVREGQITSLALHGNSVRVSFTLSPSVHLGTDTGAAAKVLTPIGQEYLELTPAGPGRLASGAVIPVDRTSIPSTLVGDLNTLGADTEQYNLPQLVKALDAAGATLGAAPARSTAAALSGLSRFSQILADRQGQLQTLVTQGADLTGVLNQRSGELVNLVNQGDLVLKVLDQRRQAIRDLLATTTSLSDELDEVLVGDRAQLGTLLGSLQTVSAVLARDGSTLADAIPVLAAFNRYAANASGSGAFVDVTVPTMLVPDDVVAACAAQQPLNTVLGCKG
jgi:phospholipid/cholesterol/gamma-HCH transport system substrate-binding protein